MKKIVLFLSLVTAFGCSGAEHSVGSSERLKLPDDGEQKLELNYQTVRAFVFEPARCLECHTSPNHRAGVDLASYEGLVASRIAVPFQPGESLLVEALANGSMPPPRLGIQLTEEQIQFVADWITAGMANSL